MNTVYLTNPGLIPMEAVTTMGVSVKETDHPIGFFGTGLKYAIASLLRMGHEITIWRGQDRYDFSVEKSSIRGKDFDLIVMTGPQGAQRLGFTTHLGAKWEMWQAFRELYSNCLDEGGSVSFSPETPEGDYTTIMVTGAAFAEVARTRDRFFLSTEPIYKGTLVSIHPGKSTGLYYRGVLVRELNQPSHYTYNITTSMDLTEDRTLKHPYFADIYVGSMLASCTDARLIEPAILSQGYEKHLHFSDPSEAFAEAVLRLCEKRGIAAIPSSARESAEQWAQREARVKAIDLSPREREDMAEAIAFLGRIGFGVTAPIIVAETLGPNILGLAKDGTIYLSRLTMARGGNCLIGTILEEHLHLTDGFLDETRRFQDFLMDLVVKFAKDAEHYQRRSLAEAA